VILVAGSLATATGSAAEPLVVDVWPGKPPDDAGIKGEESSRVHPSPLVGPTKLITNVTRPTLTIYQPAPAKNTGTAMLICPGGGYWDLYWELEGEEVAAWLNSAGITGIILKYRCPRRPGDAKGEPPLGPQLDAQRAVRLVRSRAAEWGIDPKRIGMVGFSAGGHLALATATNFTQRLYEPIDAVDALSSRPDFAVLCYSGYLKARDKDEVRPGFTIPPGTPPVFLAHASDDRESYGGSDAAHSAVMYLALKRAGVPAELHIYATGDHDFGVRQNDRLPSSWPQLCLRWLRSRDLVPADESQGPTTAPGRARWTAEQADAWGRAHPWLVGCNFTPSTAINQLEMWQADTFDLATIDRELGWAHDLGFNSVRVFLHDLLWTQDRPGLLRRMEQFLDSAAKHRIGVVFVPLDSVWDPSPRAGKQRAPRPHVHNSGWVQSPGAEILKDPARHDELAPYIRGLIGHFRGDARIHAWDLINEPDNTNRSSYGKLEPEHKPELALRLTRKVFAWAREAEPSQPLTSGVWQGDWSAPERLSPMARFQLEASDVISFHSYDPLPELKRRVGFLRRYGRPLVCTEYMARPQGSTFEAVLPYLKEEKIGAYNWGFVAGKTQTQYPWDSWQRAYNAEPAVWFHEIFRADGTPYDPKEVGLIKVLAQGRD
jgi:acetyl esterase/lipase